MQFSTIFAGAVAIALIPSGALAAKPNQKCVVTLDIGDGQIYGDILNAGTRFTFRRFQCQANYRCVPRCARIPKEWKLRWRYYPDGKGPMGEDSGDIEPPTRHVFAMQLGMLFASALAVALIPAGALAVTPPGSPNVRPADGVSEPAQQCFLSVNLGPDAMGQDTLLECRPFVKKMFDFHGYRCQMGKDCSHIRCRDFPKEFKMTSRNYPDGEGPLGAPGGDSWKPGPFVTVHPAPY
ncbi:hypothetical protein PspLS_04063 [Pyricularia sp. CBS 133598]|nr:hypothetical protein PspLS_04063 [Pyricularia sp. CBS 133598]